MSDDSIAALVEIVISGDDLEDQNLNRLKECPPDIVIQHLKAALDVKRIKSRFRAAEYLIQFDETTNYADNLDHSDATQRLIAVFASEPLNETTRPLIEQHYAKEADVIVRVACVQVLYQSDYRPPYIPLLNVMGDKELAVRRMAMDTLSFRSERLVNIPGAGVVVLKALSDRSVHIRESAAMLAGKMKLEAAIPLLLKRLDEKQGNFAGAIAALGDLRAKEAVPALLRLLHRLRDVDEDFTGYACCQALVQIGDTSIVPLLLELLQYREHLSRQRIVKLLGQLRDSRAIPALLHILPDETDEAMVRAETAIALAKLNPPGVFETLIATLMQTRVRIIRYRTIRALHYILADPRAEPYLIELLTDENQDIQGVSASAVGELGSAAAIPHVQNLVRDSLERDREFALKHARWGLEKLINKYGLFIKSQD